MHSQPDSNLFKDTLVLILAGGRGERLFPLTSNRTKGAVPFGGMYRIIDFTLTNCLHSGLRRICILPQYRFASLERHLRWNWNFFRRELGEHLDIIPPQQRVGTDWYRGTADAVFQNIYTLNQERPKHVLILPSDHIYRMDYGKLLARHAANKADLTIACMEVELDEATRFGVMAVNPSHQVIAFQEKPAVPQPMRGKTDRALVSMGIYVFDTDTLIRVLTKDACCETSHHDFGHSIIPRMVVEGWKVRSYDVQEAEGVRDFYWRDIGTIDSYWKASMELLSPAPPFDLYDPRWPVHSSQQSLLPGRVFQGGAATWICPGATIAEARVHRSILSGGVTAGFRSEVVASVLMEGVQVGPGARIHRAIVDKNVRIPAGYSIGVDLEDDARKFHVSPRGIVVVPKDTCLLPMGKSVVVPGFLSNHAPEIGIKSNGRARKLRA